MCSEELWTTVVEIRANGGLLFRLGFHAEHVPSGQWIVLRYTQLSVGHRVSLRDSGVQAPRGPRLDKPYLPWALPL